MIKQYVGLDLLDLAILAGVTIALAVAAAGPWSPNEQVGVGMVFASSLLVLAWRRARAFRRRAEADGDSAMVRHVAELQDRVAELEAGQARVLELEERLDFAERLLAREGERLRFAAPGETP